MRKRKGSKARGEIGSSRPKAVDPDIINLEAPELAGVDWENLADVHFTLDPALVERIRARRQLKSLTLRVGLEQIAEARRVAGERGQKYQAVLRQWLAEGASRARIRRMQAKSKAGSSAPKTMG